jgi:Rrf2 family protein
MLRLNRTTEYGLIALRHMNQKTGANPDLLTSAREISDTYGLPFEITAKTLQRLKELGLIQSTQGARGGYTLARSLTSVHLAQFIEWMEGSTAIVSCVENHKAQHRKTDAPAPSPCEYQPRCDIQHLMTGLNSKVYGFLSGITLLEFLAASKERVLNDAAS